MLKSDAAPSQVILPTSSVPSWFLGGWQIFCHRLFLSQPYPYVRHFVSGPHRFDTLDFNSLMAVRANSLGCLPGKKQPAQIHQDQESVVNASHTLRELRSGHSAY